MGIVVKGLKLPVDTLREGIQQVDNDIIQEEHLQNLLNVLPTEEEVCCLSKI